MGQGWKVGDNELGPIIEIPVEGSMIQAPPDPSKAIQDLVAVQQQAAQAQATQVQTATTDTTVIDQMQADIAAIKLKLGM